jgi:replicative DNA helicase
LTSIDKAISAGEGTQAKSLKDQLAEIPEVIPPRLIADDSTPEKLTALLADHGGRMAVISTEGGLFQMMAGRYTDKSNLDVYLKAWSGDTLKRDRMTSDTKIIRKPALTVGLAVQPMVIQQLSENPEFHGRGLIARFMFSLPHDTVGERNKKRRSTWDHRTADTYTDRLLMIARRYGHEDTPMRRLEVDDAALDLFQDWQQDHEDRMAVGGDLRFMSEWVTKMESTVARLAALLHVAHDKPGCVIDVDMMRRAIEVGDYWEAHAKLAHDLWGADQNLNIARAIVVWAIRSQLTSFSIRDVYNGNRKLTPTAESTIAPLKLLIERGWVRPDFDGELTVGQRGRPSQTVTLHPKAPTLSGDHALMRLMRLRDEKQESSSLTGETGGDSESPHETHETHDNPDDPTADLSSPDPNDF